MCLCEDACVVNHIADLKSMSRVVDKSAAVKSIAQSNVAHFFLTAFARSADLTSGKKLKTHRDGQDDFR